MSYTQRPYVGPLSCIPGKNNTHSSEVVACFEKTKSPEHSTEKKESFVNECAVVHIHLASNAMVYIR